jgi:hypothetical protein
MGKSYRLGFVFMLALLMILDFSSVFAAGQTKISVFNFSTANLEASGYGTSVTNMLVNCLKGQPGLAVLDRKELEAFLSLNDLQQNDNLENVTNIGNRLGLNVIVTGGVEKKGPLILITCKVIQVERKRVLLNTQVKSLGDASLASEIMRLSTMISSTVTGYAAVSPETQEPVLKGPLNVQKRSGNKRVYLSWEMSPESAASGYEIFRALSESGPFVRIAQVTVPEYLDQGVEKNTIYYYKIRSFTAKGEQSAFSAVVSAESALTPNPPIILKTERHVKSIQLTWSPAPIGSEDPLRLTGYKLYRAKVEQGPYREVGNVLGKDIAIGIDAGTALDKIFKVTYADRGLSDGDEYYYRLTAYNEKNLESDFSAPVRGISLPVIGGLSARGNMIREIKLTWDSLDSPFVRGYYVYRSTSEGADFAKIKKIDAVGNEKNVQYIDREGLGDNIRYYYRVTAMEDAERETSPSVIVSAVTRGKPPTPEALKAKSGLVKKVELEWTASSGEDVEGYMIYWSADKGAKPVLLKKIEGRNNSRHADEYRGFEKLADNTSYYYFITSYNKVDLESEPSEKVSATTKPRPANPAGLRGGELKVKEIPLEWQANSEKDINFYHVYRSSAGNEEFSRIAKVEGKTAYTDKGLKEGNTYRYRIQAEDKDGLFSDYSEIIAVKTKPKPRPPTGLAGTFRDGKAELNWNPAEEPDVTQYTIYEKRFFGPEKITTVTAASFSDSGIVKGKSKTYLITATDRDGQESDLSQEVTVAAVAQ